jgi:endonuclease YncB( thermonuclease family)
METSEVCPAAQEIRPRIGGRGARTGLWLAGPSSRMEGFPTHEVAVLESGEPAGRLILWWLAVVIGCALAALAVPVPAAVPESPQFTATTIRVRDGDSLLVRAGGRDIEVRLADVDAPERGQPHADQARKALIDLLQRREVRVEVLDTDAYRRKVARVRRLPDGLDINAEVVRTGNAWVYRRYVRDQALFALEQVARQQRAGLWALPESQRVPPWDYRERERRRSN